MSKETNNEIDRLLRGWAGREGVRPSDAGVHPESNHLDVDELNSYAENVLPPAARARYTEHLAECSRCRALVVKLSASAPVVTAKANVPAAQTSRLREFLASLFSPMVLRYAAPALALLIAAAIGLVVIRSTNRQSESVAQLTADPQSQPTSVAAEQAQTPTSFYDSAPLAGSTSPSSTASPADAGRVDPAASGAPAQAEKSTGPTPETRKEVKTEDEEVAAAPAAAQAPKPAATADDMRVEIEGRKPTESPRAAAPVGDLARQRTADAVKEEQKKVEDTQTARETAGARAGNERGRSSEPEGAFSVQSQKEKDRADGPTRSVAGRSFRKQNGVWTDTAYNPGSSIVNIARGSEQYRALVADEPEIKSIADQLDGPIIVVWKGRTYRIR